MADNPKTNEVILFDRYETKADKNGSYINVYAIGGNVYRIGNSRQEVWSVFKTLNKLAPVLLTFESFTKSKQTITYIVDAKEITEDDLLRAGLQSTMHRLLTAEDDAKYRSQALSYAKDCACANIMQNVNEIIPVAQTFFAFIKGVEDGTV